MGADVDDYAVLGLAPDADRSAVERAYRTLIKAHHPDREGGDPARAAEINRAYAHILAALDRRGEMSIHAPLKAKEPGWSPTLWAALALILLGGTATALTLGRAGEHVRTIGVVDDSDDRPGKLDIMDQPLTLSAMDAAALDAVRTAQVADEMALHSMSARCFDDFRRSPSLAQFDRCAAFDATVVRLQDRDPLRDQGPFSDVAMTSRLSSAAATLSRDRMASDSRLRQIRLHVDLLLAPPETSSTAP